MRIASCPCTASDKMQIRKMCKDGQGEKIAGRVKFIGGFLNRKRVPVLKMQLVIYIYKRLSTFLVVCAYRQLCKTDWHKWRLFGKDLVWGVTWAA